MSEETTNQPTPASGITVGVRVRPFNDRERRYNSTNIIVMNSNEAGVVRVKVVRKGVVCASERPKEFQFDHAFWSHDRDTPGSPFTDQRSVFSSLGLPVVQNVLEGYNSSLFAYGQTGSGKTYSMLGFAGDEGLTPRVSQHLFDSLIEITQDEASSFTQFVVECSYLEIYNEQVMDLLSEPSPGNVSGALKVRQHPSRGVFVEGLRAQTVQSHEDVLQLLTEGDRRRRVACTNMNATSSRSHALLLLKVTLRDSQGTISRTSKLSLVDLAGSERASSTGAEGDTLVEGSNINRSLTILGMCLDRLAEQSSEQRPGKKQSLPVPYRDSQLTFLLSESLGGNAKSTMLANISPADVNADETLSTLRFAQVAKRVKSKAVVNESATAKLIRELKCELASLKRHLSEAHEKRQQEIEHAQCLAAEALDTKRRQALEDQGAVQNLQENRDDGAAGEAVATSPLPGEQLIDPNDEPHDDEAALQVAIADRMKALTDAMQSSPEEAREYEDMQEEEDICSVGDAEENASTTSLIRSTSSVVASAPRVANDGSAVFVDWGAPQIVCMNEYVASVVHAVPSGQSTLVITSPTEWSVQASVAPSRMRGCVLTDATPSMFHFTIFYTPIDARMALHSSWTQDASVTSCNVLLDGTALPNRASGGDVKEEPDVTAADQGLSVVPVPHNARLTVQWSTTTTRHALHFRFSNVSSLPAAPKFSVVLDAADPEAARHVALLEAFGRLSMTTKYQAELEHLHSEAPGATAHNLDFTEAATKEINRQMFFIEEQLSQGYPPKSFEVAQHLRNAAVASKKQSTMKGTTTDVDRTLCDDESPIYKTVTIAQCRTAIAEDPRSAEEESDGEDDNKERQMKQLFEEVDALKEATRIREEEQQHEQDVLQQQIEAARRERRVREMSMIVRKDKRPLVHQRHVDVMEKLMHQVQEENSSFAAVQAEVQQLVDHHSMDTPATTSEIGPSSGRLAAGVVSRIEPDQNTCGGDDEEDASSTHLLPSDAVVKESIGEPANECSAEAPCPAEARPPGSEEQHADDQPRSKRRNRVTINDSIAVDPSEGLLVPMHENSMFVEGAGVGQGFGDSADNEEPCTSAMEIDANVDDEDGTAQHMHSVDTADTHTLSELHSGYASAIGATPETPADTAAIEDELQWQQSARDAQQARPNGPTPRDHPLAAEDLGLWQRYASDPKEKLPFLKEILTKQLDYYWAVARQDESNQSAPPMAADAVPLPPSGNMSFVSMITPLSTAPPPSYQAGEAAALLGTSKHLLPAEEQRAGYMWKLNQGLQSTKWEYRFAILSGRFLHYFYNADGTCRCLAALYLYGATCSILQEPLEGKPFVIHLKITAPRRAKDKATSFYFAFATAAERCWWMHWLVCASAPPLPPSLRRKLEREAQEQGYTIAASGLLAGSSPHWLVPPSKWSKSEDGSPATTSSASQLTRDRASEIGDSSTGSGLLHEKHLHWTPDESSPSCTECGQPFGFFRRRHHCRACGLVFCDSCTKTVDMLNQRNELKKKRACNKCVAASISRVGRGSLLESESTRSERSGSAAQQSSPTGLPSGGADTGRSPVQRGVEDTQFAV